MPYTPIPSLAGCSLVLVTSACLLGCAPEGIPPKFDDGDVPQVDSPSALSDRWWEAGPIMQIYVRSYRDTNGDGKGDLPGIIEKLDYLKALGVKGIWMTPVFQSQDQDHGYSVTDYRNIDPDLGTLADFDSLVSEAHARGIGLIIDYVANHSARQHPAFVRSEAAGTYRDWYVWRAADPGGWTTWNTAKPDPWTADGTSGVFYAVFSDQMPDFNLDNPAVLEFHRNNLRFWLNRGVDGVRFDAVSELTNLQGGAQDDAGSAVISGALSATVKGYPNRWAICEAATAEIQGQWAPARHASASACGAAFGFPLNFIFNEITASQRPTLGKASESLTWFFANFPAERMGTLLGNHDYFAATLDGTYRGREYDIVGGDVAAYKFAAALNLLSPGIPFIYYGEEIGMSKQTGDPGQYEQLRAPMSWDLKSGFSSRTPYRPYATNRAPFNVAAETDDPGSLLGWYQQLIQLRAKYPVLQRGLPEAIDGGAANGAAFVYTRVLGSDRVWLVYNPGKVTASVTSALDAPVEAIFNPGNVKVDRAGARLTFSEIPPRGVAVWKQLN